MVTPPVGIEYDNTIEASSLSTDQVAELTLNNNQYSKIELDNTAGAKGVILKTVLSSIDISGEIEISGKALEFLELRGAHGTIETFQMSDFSVRGIDEVRIYSDTVKLIRGEAAGVAVTGKNVYVEKFDVRDAFNIKAENDVTSKSLTTTILSCESGSLALVNSYIKEGKFNVRGLISTADKLEALKLYSNSGVFNGNGNIVVGDAEILAQSIELGAKVEGSKVSLKAKERLNYYGSSEVIDRLELSGDHGSIYEGKIKAATIEIRDSNGCCIVTIESEIVATRLLELYGNYKNIGTISASELIAHKQFENEKIIRVDGSAMFEGNLRLLPYSMTTVGYFRVGDSGNKVDELECVGCQFVATSESETSTIYARSFIVEPKEFRYGAVDKITVYPVLCDSKWHWDSYVRYVTGGYLIEAPRCAACVPHIDWDAEGCRDSMKGSTIAIHKPNCDYIQKGEFTVGGDLNLYANSLTIKIAILDVKGSLRILEKSSLSLAINECSKYAEGDDWWIDTMIHSTIKMKKYIGLQNADNIDSLLGKYGIGSYVIELEEHSCSFEFNEKHWWEKDRGCVIFKEINGAYKSIIKARSITGSVSSAQLGSAYEGYSSTDLTVYNPNAIAARDASLVPHIEMSNLQLKITTDYGNGKLMVKTINPSQYFASQGLDINLMINYRQLESRVWSLDPVPNTGLIASSSSEPYTLHYYVRLDGSFTPNFDPKVFLEQIAFDAKGIVYTTDGHYTEKLVRDAVFTTIGAITGYDQIELVNTLARNGYNAWLKENLTPGRALTSWQIAQLDYPMIWPVWSDKCGGIVNSCLSYELYYNQQALADFLYGANLIAEETLDLKIDGDLIIGYLTKIGSKNGQVRLNIAGHVAILGNLAIEGNTEINVDGNFISLGEINSVDDLAVKALNIGIAGEVKAGNDLTMVAMQNLIVATLKAVSEVGSYSDGSSHYSHHERITTETKITAGGKLGLGSGNDLAILGAYVIGNEVYIKSQDGKVQIVPVELYNKVVNEGRRYYYERQSLTYYQPKIEALSENTADIENGVVRLSNEVAKHGGATGIIIEGGSGILLRGVNVTTDKKLTLGSDNGDIKIETPNEYKSMVYSYTKRRGGLAGVFGGKSTHTERMEEETPLYSRIVAPIIEFFSPKHIEIGADIVTYAVELKNDGATKDAMISVLPKVKKYAYEVKTKKTGLMFEFSDSGNFMFAGTKLEGKSQATVEVIPTIIQIGGISDDPNDHPRFIGYSKGKFILASSRIEEREDESGNKKSVIAISAEEIELESIPNSRFDFAILDEKGVGTGFSVNSKEVAVKAGAFFYKEESTKVTIEHKNPAGFLGGFLQLKADQTISDVAAIYNVEQADIHAKIVFHGVAKDSISQTDMSRTIEAGVKLGIKLGSIGRVIDAATRLKQQDFDRPEGFINAGFAGLEVYREVMSILSGTGGISGGVWGYAEYKEESSESVTTREIPTTMRVGTLKIEAEEWKFIGTQIEAYRAYIKTKYLDAKSGKLIRESHSESTSWNVDIPISPGSSGGIGMGFSNSDSKEEYAMNARIHIHQDLRLEVTGHANMRGITVSAKSIEAFFNSLLLESVQDISNSISRGANIGFSTEDVSNIGGNFANGERHAVSEITSILGEEKCYIVVANALRLNGAMIAAASRTENGELTDHGKLTLRVGELFIQHIYDYDEGVTLGASISQTSVMPTFGGKSGEGYTKATIGKGDVSCTTEGGECQIDEANRDVENAQTFKVKYDIRPITLYIPTKPTPPLPRTDSGEVDWGKVKDNVVNQIAAPFKEIARLFVKVAEKGDKEQLKPPITISPKDESAEGDAVNDQSDDNKNDNTEEESIINKLYKELVEKYGKEEAEEILNEILHIFPEDYLGSDNFNTPGSPPTPAALSPAPTPSNEVSKEALAKKLIEDINKQIDNDSKLTNDQKSYDKKESQRIIKALLDADEAGKERILNNLKIIYNLNQAKGDQEKSDQEKNRFERAADILGDVLGSILRGGVAESKANPLTLALSEESIRYLFTALTAVGIVHFSKNIDTNARLNSGYSNIDEDDKTLIMQDLLGVNRRIVVDGKEIEFTPAQYEKLKSEGKIVNDGLLNYIVGKIRGIDELGNLVVLDASDASADSNSFGSSTTLDAKNKNNEKGEQKKGKVNQESTGITGSPMPNPNNNDDDGDDKNKLWKKNKDNRFHHPEAGDIEGIHNKPNAQNQQLRKELDELYKQTDEYPRGTAGKLRDEIEKGLPKEHLIKARERISQLKRIIDNEPLSRTDRKIAERVINDLRSAIKQAGGLQ